MEDVALRAGLILLYIVTFACLILTVLGLSGNWVIVAIALVIKLAGLGEISWVWWFVMVGLAALGEVIESLLGLVVVARKGGTRWGVGGSFVGGIVGAVVGAGVVPPIGSLLLAFVGAFAGAAVGEYWRHRHADAAMRIGFWSFVGRALAAMVKVAIGLAIVWMIILRTW